MNKAYSVCLWLTHPDLGNDDCMTGADFDTLAEAKECAAHLDGHFTMSYFSDCPFVEIDGPDYHSVIELPGVAKRAKRQARFDARLESNEHAMQAGMTFGIQGYNDALGC